MAWVVELGYFDPVDATEKVVRFARGPGLALSDQGWIAPGLVKWASPTQKLTIAKETGVVSASTDAGQIEVTNLPADIGQAGRFDWIADKVFQGRAAALYWTATTWAARIRVDSGVIEQPTMNFSLGGQVQGFYAFRLRDPRSALTANLQPTLYAGSNANGQGVEGTGADLKGQPKPILLGRASNIPGVKVNQSLLIWQIADVAVSVDCARDGGIGLGAGVLRSSLASLQATSPAAGTFDYYAGAEGSFARLGSNPQFRVTFDAYEGASRTPAQIWSRLRARCGSTNLDTASVTACDALDAGESGFWWDGALTQLDALNEVLAGFSGYEFLTAAGLWKVQKLAQPSASGATVVDLAILSPSSAKTAKARDLVSIQMVRPDYAPDGAPPYQVNVQWGRAYSVMGASDFAGAAPQRLRDKFGQEWRAATSSQFGNWNPTTGAGPWKNAPSLTLPSGYQAQIDGTCPAAVAESARLLAIFSVVRPQWQVAYTPEIADAVSLGDVAGLTLPGFGLSAGGRFRVLQSSFTLDQNGPQTGLILGLQRLAGDA